MLIYIIESLNIIEYNNRFLDLCFFYWLILGLGGICFLFLVCFGSSRGRVSQLFLAGLVFLLCELRFLLIEATFQLLLDLVFKFGFQCLFSGRIIFECIIRCLRCFIPR